MIMPTTTASEILAKWLAEALDKAGKSQSDLARDIDLSSQKINRMVQGAREISGVELIKISDALDVPIPSLSGNSTPEVAKQPSHDAAQPPAQNGTVSNFSEEAYDKAFTAALEIEKREFGGNMPLQDFINAVTIGLKRQKN
ncbi:helix-turn-helix domain-containing protein [Pseudovibrio sp. WM33]|uniref:helix-turn-helix domain-containing protein n=1 Tax=Pseudovibrio sp. WM33 TaxID=1735585 RepID=UPI0007B29CEA|nr:helix-turn-helix transcriptional regulator [Pseudovibrio sp. WM33]KZL17515.1 helix-turn-helix protein [Pseudovibrio sp. WM33]